MTLDEFVEKYKGKVVDFDKTYGAQCVDLVRQYFQDVWNLPEQPESVGNGGAKDFYYKHNERPKQGKYLNCHSYIGVHTPPVGSVVVFKPTDDNKDGHIAVCINATYDYIDVLEQDGVYNLKAKNEGREQKPAYIAKWSYKRLLGWLVKKEC